MRLQVLGTDILNYSLLPTGFLMLGTSETVGDASDYFTLVDRKNKVYSRRQVASAGTLDIAFGVHMPDPRRPIEVPTGQRGEQPGPDGGTKDRRALRAAGGGW